VQHGHGLLHRPAGPHDPALLGQGLTGLGGVGVTGGATAQGIECHVGHFVDNASQALRQLLQCAATTHFGSSTVCTL
jgi:hypothetical protein